MRGTGVRIVTATAIGGASRLESTWLRAFGPGDRPLGWFAQKIRRERVDDELTQVAVLEGADLREPRSWCGFVLAGRLPSRGGAVRTAGTAVVPDLRGHGIGGALLTAARRAAAQSGSPSLELVAEESTIPYYQRHGFAFRRELVTLETTAGGEAPTLDAPTLDAPPLGDPVEWAAAEAGLVAPEELCAWTPEAWSGSVKRHAVDLRGEGGLVGRALVSQEGAAWLVHRCVIEAGTSAREALAAVSAALPAPASVVLPGCGADAVRTITAAAALRPPVRVAQRGALLVIASAGA